MPDAIHHYKQQILRAAGWTGFTKGFGQVLTFATTLLLVRLLGSEDFGLFAMALIYTWAIDNVAELGFQSAIIQRETISNVELSSCFWLLLIMSLGIIVFSQFAAAGVAWFFSEERLTLIVRILSLAFLTVPQKIVCTGLLSRNLHLDLIAKAELGAGIIRCGVSIASALSGAGIFSLVYGYLAERLSLSIALLWAAKWYPAKIFSFSRIRPLISFGVAVTASRLLWFGYSKIDTLIIGRLLGADVLGFYSIALQIALSFFQFISSVYYRIAFPILSKLQNSPTFKDIFLKSIVYLSIIALPIFFGMTLVADDLVPMLLGDRWHAAILPFQVLSIVAALQTLSGLIPQAMNALGRVDISIWTNSVSLIVFGIGFYLGARWHDLHGVLVVWLILFPLRYAILIVWACTVMKLSVTQYLSGHTGPIVSAAVMTVSVAVVSMVSSDWSAAIRLGFCVFTGAVIYASVHLFFFRPLLIELLNIRKMSDKASL